jgi:hypothetical protein
MAGGGSPVAAASKWAEHRLEPQLGAETRYIQSSSEQSVFPAGLRPPVSPGANGLTGSANSPSQETMNPCPTARPATVFGLFSLRQRGGIQRPQKRCEPSGRLCRMGEACKEQPARCSESMKRDENTVWMGVFRRFGTGIDLKLAPARGGWQSGSIRHFQSLAVGWIGLSDKRG